MSTSPSDGIRTSFGITATEMAARTWLGDYVAMIKEDFKRKHLAAVAADGREFDPPTLYESEGLHGDTLFDWISFPVQPQP